MKFSIHTRAAPRLFALLSVLTASSPAMAWKPTMHVYLAERALEDARDGDVTIDRVDYWRPDQPGVPLGDYPVHPDIRRALVAHPEAFRAGAIGPDAYPDLMTGQSVIHAQDHNASGPGTDAWLEFLWQEARANGDDEVMAFVLGFFAHAAGDMYGHTMVNHYAGGPWDLADVSNPVRHVVVEGYIGKHSPLPVFENNGRPALDIGPPVQEFVYHKMIDARPGTAVRALYDAKGGTAQLTFPMLFSNIRDVNTEFLAWRAARKRWFQRQLASGNALLGPVYAAFMASTAPLVSYSGAWIDDIDRGLRAWPAYSTRIARAIMYQPHGSDFTAARAIFDEYERDHLLSMLGLPDVAVAVINFINDVLALLPVNPLTELKNRILDYLIERTTGRTRSEWVDFVTDPEANMDRVFGPGVRSHVEGLMHLDAGTTVRIHWYYGFGLGETVDRFTFFRKLDWTRFEPAYNTVTMTKLSMLGERGLRMVERDVGRPAHVPTNDSLNKNAALGFIKSLDGSEQWHQNSSQLFLHEDCYVYQHIFKIQEGEETHREGGHPDNYYYLAGGSSYERCARAVSVDIRARNVTINGPYCGYEVEAYVQLDRPVGPAGGLVKLQGSGPIVADEHVWMPGGQDRGSFPVFLGGVLDDTRAELTVTRQNSSPSDDVTVREPHLIGFRLMHATWDGQRGDGTYLSPGDTVLHNERLVAEVELDCGRRAAGTAVELSACPVGVYGTCVSLGSRTLHENGQLQLDIPFDLPLVEGTAPQNWVVYAEYLDMVRGYPLVLRPGRVRSVRFEDMFTQLGAIGRNSMPVTITLSTPARKTEVVDLVYLGPIGGPASVTFQVGEVEAEVIVSLPRGSLMAECSSEIVTVRAASEIDRVWRSGHLGFEHPNNGRNCFDLEALLDLDERVDRLVRLLGQPWFEGDPSPIPPIEERL